MDPSGSLAYIRRYLRYFWIDDDDWGFRARGLQWLFLDIISRKSYGNAYWIYIPMKSAVNLLKKSIKDTEFLLSDNGSLWIPTQYGVLDPGSERISCLIAKEDLRSQWICRQTVRVGSMIRTDPGSRSLGSDPGIHFRDPRTCLLHIV